MLLAGGGVPCSLPPRVAQSTAPAHWHYCHQGTCCYSQTTIEEQQSTIPATNTSTQYQGVVFHSLIFCIILLANATFQNKWSFGRFCLCVGDIFRGFLDLIAFVEYSTCTTTNCRIRITAEQVWGKYKKHLTSVWSNFILFFILRIVYCPFKMTFLESTFNQRFSWTLLPSQVEWLGLRREQVLLAPKTT